MCQIIQFYIVLYCLLHNTIYTIYYSIHFFKRIDISNLSAHIIADLKIEGAFGHRFSKKTKIHVLVQHSYSLLLRTFNRV